MASSSRHPPARSLLALFGPTASGKTAVAGTLRERIGATVVSADSAALYAGLPLITAAPSLSRRARRDRSARRRRARSAPTNGSLMPPSMPAEVAARRRRDGPVLPRSAFRASSCRRLPRRAVVSTGRKKSTGSARTGHTRCSPSATLQRRRACMRTTASGSSARSSLQRPAPRWRPETDRLWTEDTRLPTLIVALDVPLDELDRRIDARTRAMAAAGAAAEARRRPGPGLCRSTARKVLGLEQFATLPEARSGRRSRTGHP